MTRARDVANVLTAANVLSTDIESAAAISAHTGITDPHPAYLQESTFSANQIVYKNASNEATGSANLTFSGSDLSVAGTIRSTASAGDEGGEIFLNKSVTNTTLTGGVVLDVNQNRLRIFEEGGSNRGYYLDMASGGTGVGTNLGSSGSMTLLNTTTLSGASTTISSISGAYTNLRILIYGVTNNTANGNFTLTWNSLGNNNNYTITRYNGDGGASPTRNAPNDALYLNAVSDQYNRTSALNFFSLLVENYASASTYKALSYNGYYVGASFNEGQTGGGGVNTTSAITQIVLANSGGTFAGGTCLIYGVK